MLTFDPALRHHARAINEMRDAARQDLTQRLGPGPWSNPSHIQSIRERISLGDPIGLTRKTIFVASQGEVIVGSVAVTSFLPAFMKAKYWQDPKSKGLGVFDLVVHHELQKQGLGRFLMEACEQLARDHGFSYVRLDAFAENSNSIGFYRTIGYDERCEIDVRGCRLRLFEKRVS